MIDQLISSLDKETSPEKRKDLLYQIIDNIDPKSYDKNLLDKYMPELSNMRYEIKDELTAQKNATILEIESGRLGKLEVIGNYTNLSIDEEDPINSIFKRVIKSFELGDIHFYEIYTALPYNRREHSWESDINGKEYPDGNIVKFNRITTYQPIYKDGKIVDFNSKSLLYTDEQIKLMFKFI